MSRPSNRTSILDAAVRVAASKPVMTITIESVAAEAGMTKAGVIYHFPTKAALLRALHQERADEWEARLVAEAGKPFEETTAEERGVAYLRVAATSASRADLVFLLEAKAHPESAEPLLEMIGRWTPDLDDDAAALRLILLRLVADGLWLGGQLEDLSPAVRENLAAELVRALAPS